MKKTDKRHITYLSILSPLALGLVLALIGERFIKGFSDGWVGFIATCSGIISTALIMVYIMQKTNAANQEIQDKNSRILYCNDLAELIGQYCALITQYFIYMKEMWYSVNALSPRLNISNKDYHEERLNKYRELCELEVRKTDALFFVIDIKLKGVDGADLLINRLNTVQEISKKENLGFDEFKEHTDKLMESTTEFIKEYTKSK